LGYAGVAVCGYGIGYATGLIIVCVYTVGWMFVLSCVVTYVSGFYPPYCNIYYCFYLIFAFGANIFLIDLLCVTTYVCVALLTWRATSISTCLVSMSSAVSFVSASANTNISLPLVVA
jgi:hypothetical protein